MVGVRGLEPPTSASQALRAPKLRYTPIKVELSIPIKSKNDKLFGIFFSSLNKNQNCFSKPNLI